MVKNAICLTTVLGLILYANGKNANISRVQDNPSISVSEASHAFLGTLTDFDLSKEVLRVDLFIGDSRTQGMLLSGVIDENHTIYGVGYGYNWLVGNGKFRENKTNAVNGALNYLSTIMDEDKLYNIVIWLGVNDYGYKDANAYFEEYASLATEMLSDQKIFVVSVGPVNDRVATTVSNEQINNFNDTLKALIEDADIDNLKYIDLDLNSTSIKNYDRSGIHYSDQDYVNIYNLIKSHINEESIVKRLSS